MDNLIAAKKAKRMIIVMDNLNAAKPCESAAVFAADWCRLRATLLRRRRGAGRARPGMRFAAARELRAGLPEVRRAVARRQVEEEWAAPLPPG